MSVFECHVDNFPHLVINQWNYSNQIHGKDTCHVRLIHRNQPWRGYARDVVQKAMLYKDIEQS